MIAFTSIAWRLLTSMSKEQALTGTAFYRINVGSLPGIRLGTCEPLYGAMGGGVL